MSRVCMLLSNPCVNDSRVLREARALAAAGYKVRIVATQAEGVPPAQDRDGFRILRVPSEPRLSGAVRRLLVRLSALRPRAAPAGRAEPGAAGGPERESVLGQEAWVAAAGDAPDRALLRDPRAAAIRSWLRLHQTLAWWRFGRAAWEVVRREPADVYVAHDLDTLPLGVLAKSRLGGRLVYDSHELYTEVSPAPPPSPLWRPRWRLAERLLIGRADAVITVCDGIAGELVDRYGIARPAVVRNIPELAEAPGGGEDGLRSRLDIRPDVPVALYLGGIQLNRRLEHYLDAVARLPDVVLVLLGPGDPSYVSHLRAYAEELGIAERVRIPGPVPPELVTAHARDADVGLIVLRRGSLSQWYTLPSKLFESIQAGLPVVTNDWPELRRVVEDYGVGVLCDSDEPAAIAAAVRTLLEDRERYERIRESARRASKELNWQRESKRLLEVIGAVDGRVAAAG